MTDIKEGDEVYSTRMIWDAPSGDSPGGVYCYALEKLEVVEVFHDGEFGFSVRHPGVKGRFYARATEVSKMKPFRHNVPREHLHPRDRA